jgi:type IV pilus assembly protein PilB
MMGDMATQTAPQPARIPNEPTLGPFLQFLIARSLLTEPQARQAEVESHRHRTSLVAHLAEKAKLAPSAVALALSQHFDTPLLDADALVVDPECLPLGEEQVIRGTFSLPFFRRGKCLYIAVSDLTHHLGIDKIRFKTNLDTVPVLVEHDKLIKAIERAFNEFGSFGPDASVDESNYLDEVDFDSGSEMATQNLDVVQENNEEEPIVRFIKKTLLHAIQKGASDIHFEPYETFYRVRLRIDGILCDYSRPPIQSKDRIVAFLKNSARLRTDERRIPQDGKVRVSIGPTRALDFRVSCVPTVHGEKIVMRVLDPGMTQIGIKALGFEPHQEEIYLRALARSQGMILVTGPTGSGKTVTMYAGINKLNTVERNISTAEDPVEIQLVGVNQVNVQPKLHFGFADALRAFLRQDPDVILVGEIRDPETADVAIKAAQTGHLVLSTLHTNDAPQTLTRLRDMGVPAYSVASSVCLIISQRLARRLCEHCRQPFTPTPAVLGDARLPEDIANRVQKLYRPNPAGCENCQLGYKGRIGIYQVFPISEAMSALMMDQASSIAIAAQAHKEGIWDLRRCGLDKVIQGITTLEEIDRVISS